MYQRRIRYLNIKKLFLYAGITKYLTRSICSCYGCWVYLKPVHHIINFSLKHNVNEFSWINIIFYNDISLREFNKLTRFINSNSQILFKNWKKSEVFGENNIYQAVHHYRTTDMLASQGVPKGIIVDYDSAKVLSGELQDYGTNHIFHKSFKNTLCCQKGN